MFYILKNIMAILLLHIMIYIMNCIAIYLFVTVMFHALGDNVSPVVYDILNWLVLLFLISKLFILPVAYKQLEKSEQFILLSKFIKKLKKSLSLKFVILCVAFFLHDVQGFKLSRAHFYSQFMGSFIIGFLGCYLVLYLYWYIESKLKILRAKKQEKE